MFKANSRNQPNQTPKNQSSDKLTRENRSRFRLQFSLFLHTTGGVFRRAVTGGIKRGLLLPAIGKNLGRLGPGIIMPSGA
jgi:hypothetical protein